MMKMKSRKNDNKMMMMKEDDKKKKKKTTPRLMRLKGQRKTEIDEEEEPVFQLIVVE